MSKLEIFKPSNFFLLNEFSVQNRMLDAEESAKRCNEIINEFIEKNGVKLWGYKGKTRWLFDDRESIGDSTHTAIAINIEPIKKKCERHEPDLGKTTVLGGYSECSNCGVKLKAEWKEVE